MPLRWATLFRIAVLLALSAHEMVMYRLARTLSGPALHDASDIILAGLFAFAMLVPLVWAVTLPELPEIYTRVVRARRWYRQGRCPNCGYEIGSEAIERCPECGKTIAPPREYAVTSATIWRYAFMNGTAWLVGCMVGEWSLRHFTA
jgi:hypothetical protein